VDSLGQPRGFVVLDSFGDRFGQGTGFLVNVAQGGEVGSRDVFERADALEHGQSLLADRADRVVRLLGFGIGQVVQQGCQTVQILDRIHRRAGGAAELGKMPGLFPEREEIATTVRQLVKKAPIRKRAGRSQGADRPLEPGRELQEPPGQHLALLRVKAGRPEARAHLRRPTLVS
jgi:hypothetical protein